VALAVFGFCVAGAGLGRRLDFGKNQ